jgi:hypothetical protein
MIEGHVKRPNSLCMEIWTGGWEHVSIAILVVSEVDGNVTVPRGPENADRLVLKCCSCASSGQYPYRPSPDYFHVLQQSTAPDIFEQHVQV